MTGEDDTDYRFYASELHSLLALAILRSGDRGDRLGLPRPPWKRSGKRIQLLAAGLHGPWIHDGARR